ncbi:hemolytic protein HlpA-like protein [Calothrix sp. NIES-4101]|nr:hemolytic protein HlpA-like protein [Calothrix sp. NIES-4101]
MKTPVAFIVFKRPHTTEKVFDAIRQAKPKKLLVIADGARSNQAFEAEKCQATRIIIERVDWDCEVLKNYSDTNLGCAKRVSSGLDWVFEQVEEAIILEDDCLPHPTFFRFCEELLEKYKHDERIASISGQNVQFGRTSCDSDYYFSRYNHIWGWATWKRAWKNYDFYMNYWPQINQHDFLMDILGNPKAVKIWTKVFQKMYDGNHYGTWDFQWQFACWLNHSLGIISHVNLVSNIGFGADSAHITGEKSILANMPTQAINFPIKHPEIMIRHLQADNITLDTLFSSLNPNLFQRLIWKMLKK